MSENGKNGKLIKLIELIKFIKINYLNPYLMNSNNYQHFPKKLKRVYGFGLFVCLSFWERFGSCTCFSNVLTLFNVKQVYNRIFALKIVCTGLMVHI